MPELAGSVHATFRVATPLFLGGFDPRGQASARQGPLRVASIKGVLRFWWRAMQWSRVRAGASSDVAALQQLHQSEQALFGEAADERHPRHGQSRVLLSATCETSKVAADLDRSGYLLGQGLWDTRAGKLTRQASTIEQFDLRLLFRSDTSPSDRESVLEAVWAFGLLGGLGARSRRGLGSVCLTAWRGNATDLGSRFPIPTTLRDYRNALAQLTASRAIGASPPYTAFSGRTRVDISAHRPARSPRFPGVDLLAFASATLSGFRRLGKDAQQRDLPQVQAINAGDYALMRGYMTDNGIQAIPKRSAFGLPHNYFFIAEKQSLAYSLASEQPESNRRAHKSAATLGRRASPLLLHVHALPDNTAVLTHILFPSDFFPSDGAVMMKRSTDGRSFTRKVSDTEIHWPLLHNYLDAYATRDTVCGSQGDT